MDCCASLAKYTLFCLNFLFWLAGVSLLGVGIWIQVDPNFNNIVTVAGISFYVGAISFIVVGTLMLLIGFCGCCGAIKENRCLLGTYFTLVLLIFFTQVGVAIWAFVSHSSIESAIKTGLNETIPINPTSTAEYDAIVSLQQNFQCCGLLNGCSDWMNNNASGCTCKDQSAVASNGTCVTATSQNCTNGDHPGQLIYTEDCFDAILDFIEDNIIVIGAVALAIALSEIFVMIFAMMVCHAAKNKYETV